MDALFNRNVTGLAPSASIQFMAKAKQMQEMGLDVPSICQMGITFRQAGIDFPEDIFREADAVKALLQLWKGAGKC